MNITYESQECLQGKAVSFHSSGYWRPYTQRVRKHNNRKNIWI